MDLKFHDIVIKDSCIEIKLLNYLGGHKVNRLLRCIVNWLINKLIINAERNLFINQQLKRHIRFKSGYWNGVN